MKYISSALMQTNVQYCNRLSVTRGVHVPVAGQGPSHRVIDLTCPSLLSQTQVSFKERVLLSAIFDEKSVTECVVTYVILYLEQTKIDLDMHSILSKLIIIRKHNESFRFFLISTVFPSSLIFLIFVKFKH